MAEHPTSSPRGSRRGPQPVRRSSPLSRLERDAHRQLVAGAAALGALGAVAAGPSPTGGAAVDAVLVAGGAAATVVAFANARRTTWLVGAGIAALNVGDPVGVLCAAAAVLAAFGAGISPGPRRRIVGGVVGAVTVVALAHQAELAFQGASAALAAAAVAPAVGSALRGARSATRRRVRRAVVGLATASIVAVAGFAAAAAGTRSDLEQARDAAERGFDALSEGEQDEAVASFDEAARAFRSAELALRAPWAAPVRLVPVAAQHAKAVDAVAVSGVDVAHAASTAARSARYDDLRARGGQVDLALLTSMRDPVAGAHAALTEAAARLEAAESPWLVPAVGDPLRDVRDEVVDAVPDAELAVDALTLAPALLGGAGERRYLVLFGNTAESRFLGGFVGGYGILDASDGGIELEVIGRVDDLDTPTGSVGALPWDTSLRDRYARWEPDRYLQNATVTPDFPADAALARMLAPAYGLGEVDGVLYVDPEGLAALLELTGPVEVPALGERVSASTVADLLLRDQYARFETKDERGDVLTEVARATFEALTQRELPGPRKLSAVLDPAVDGGHLLFNATEPGEQALFDRMGAAGSMPVRGAADLLSVRTANNGPNKLDAYLRRSATYEVTIDPTNGTATADLTVTLTNDAPAGLGDYVAGNRRLRAGDPDAPPAGSNLTYLSVFTSLEVVSVLVDGTPAVAESHSEFGWRTWSLPVVVPRGGSVEIRFALEGTSLTAREYSLDVVPQPAPVVTPVEIAVRPAPGWRVVPADGLTHDERGRAVASVDRRARLRAKLERVG